MEFHDAANLFPLDEETLNELAEDIRLHGQQKPIEILNGVILDGRRRFKACQQLGIEPLMIEVNPPDPYAYVVSLNLRRRHLSVSQRAMVGAQLREHYDRLARERQKEAGRTHGRGKEKVVPILAQPIEADKPSRNPAVRDQVATLFGVNHTAIDQATKVLREGTPELIQAVKEDRCSVSSARVLGLPLPPEEQIAWAKRQDGSRKKCRDDKSVEPESSPESTTVERKVIGVGMALATQAVDKLKDIPLNDPLRGDGFAYVKRWISSQLKGAQ